MRTRLLLCALVASLAALGSAQKPAEYKPGEILVKFKNSVNPMMASLAHRKLNAKVVRTLPVVGTQKVKLTGTSVAQALNYYRSLPTVEYAEPNYYFEKDYMPNDSFARTQYNIVRLRAIQAWDVSKGLPTVRVAIIDDGIDMDHPDLAPKIVAPRDFVDDDNFPQEGANETHGSHCAGIAAGATDNGIGIAGVGFNASIMPLRVDLSTEQIVDAITYAVNNGAKVISMSFGSYTPSDAILQATEFAWSRGVNLFATAGNDGINQNRYPGDHPKVVTVGSTDDADQRSVFSNFGDWVEVAAPGSDIISTVNGGGYEELSGTSMACPAVAGVAALLWSYARPGTTNAEIRKAIEDNVDPVGNWLRLGRVNAERAIKSLKKVVQKKFAAEYVGMFEGVDTSGSSRDVEVVDLASVSILSENRNRLGYVASATFGFRLDTLESLDSLDFKLKTSGDKHVTGMMFLWNWGTERWDLLRSFPMNVDGTANVSVPFRTGLTQYMTPGGDIRVLVRGILPQRHYNGLSRQFTLSIDHLELEGSFVQ